MQFSHTLEADEMLYTYSPANNGASPFWCRANTCIVECKGRVFAAGLETLPGVKPLSNCVPRFYAHERDSWSLIYKGEGRTREPSPVACFPDGRVFLSLNTSLVDENQYDGPSKPSILVFDAESPDAGYREIELVWDGDPPFTEHSYRSFVVDSAQQELIIIQNIQYGHAEYAVMDSDERWISGGQIVWPWGAEYDTPQPIRICYPLVQMKDRRLYFLGVSDIIEPYGAWRNYKKELTGRDWDYDFRRLFFVWSDDITQGKFHNWIELASRDKTAGHIHQQDMFVDEDETVHILWTESSLDERLRDRFFPLESSTNSLHYMQIRNGVVRLRRALYVGGEGEMPGAYTGAKFHRSTDGRLFVLININAEATGDGPQLKIAQLIDGCLVDPQRVDIKVPFQASFTNTPRAGSSLSDTVHMLTNVQEDEQHSVRYVRIGVK